MKKIVKTFSQFVNETLSKEEWVNYYKETSLSSDDVKEDVIKVSNKIEKFLETNIKEILVTSDDVSTGEDLTYFIDELVPKSNEIKTDSLYFEDFVAYFTLYDYKGKKFVILNIRDYIEYSFAFIRKHDYDFFNEAPGEKKDFESTLPETEENEIEEAPEENLEDLPTEE